MLQEDESFWKKEEEGEKREKNRKNKIDGKLQFFFFHGSDAS